MIARLFAVLLLGLVGVSAVLSPSAASAQSQRCFPETGYCVSGPIRAYWERSGGLPVFGYPISPQREETVEGRRIQVQWFERDRLEIQGDGTITAGRLGARLLELQGRPWESFASEEPSGASGCGYFDRTRFNVCGGFLSYWERSGGLERFGYPISPVIQEQIEGRSYAVQYFERRRMEYHPENPAPYDVLLGLLGREVLALPDDSPAGGGGTPIVDVLSGTTWQWVLLSDPLQQVTIADPSRYTITFSNGAVSVKADCNQGSGSYAAGPDGALNIKIGPVTRAACPPDSRGDEFVRKLGLVSRFSFQGSDLLLELPADGGTLTLARP